MPSDAINVMRFLLSGIIKHINDEYSGCSVDGAGNVTDCSDSGDTIGNNQLRFLSYSEYSYMKHGYLRKHNRLPIPNCMVCGIHQSYRDKNNFYVGFRKGKGS